MLHSEIRWVEDDEVPPLIAHGASGFERCLGVGTWGTPTNPPRCEATAAPDEKEGCPICWAGYRYCLNGLSVTAMFPSLRISMFHWSLSPCFRLSILTRIWGTVVLRLLTALPAAFDRVVVSITDIRLSTQFRILESCGFVND